MARSYRLQAKDCFYYITSRGNGRKKIFLNNTDFQIDYARVHVEISGKEKVNLLWSMI
jgi:REP element-mobilizing transposase RayT